MGIACSGPTKPVLWQASKAQRQQQLFACRHDRTPRQSRPSVPRKSAVTALPVPLQTIALLVVSNVFMTFAWYSHLKHLGHRPLIHAVLFSWGIAFFEYLLMVPANRIGHSTMSISQLKILQEVITLSVFVPFVVLYMKEPFKLDYVWAALCMVGAVYFMFRS